MGIPQSGEEILLNDGCAAAQWPGGVIVWRMISIGCLGFCSFW